jgi:hypothetical protein
MQITSAQTGIAAVTDNTTGTVFDASPYNQLKVYIKAASVSTGATVSIKQQSPEGDWHEVYSVSVSSSGNQDVVYLPGPFDLMRIDIESRTDGTYTATVSAI